MDTAETIYISSLALLKMLKHGAPSPDSASLPPLSVADRSVFFFLAGRAGVPMEVMGLMLGEFVDDYTIVVSPTDRSSRCVLFQSSSVSSLRCFLTALAPFCVIAV